MYTIYVSIPSYKDESVLKTARDCLEKAAHPDRVFLFVCEQIDRETSVRTLGLPRTTVDTLPGREAQGPCYARARLEKMMIRSLELHRHKPIIFMVDAHMLFAPGWDEILCQEMAALPEMGILTHYPKAYLYGPRWNPDPRRAVMVFKRKNEFGIYTFVYELHSVRGHVMTKGLAAGCLAFNHNLLYEVPYLQEVPYLFLGEEQCMWMRYFCAGYDLYTPERDIVQTTYHRGGRANFSAQSKQHRAKLDLYTRSISLIQEHMKGHMKKGQDYGGDELATSFHCKNRRKIQVREPALFSRMLDWMARHRGPLTRDAYNDFLSRK